MAGASPKQIGEALRPWTTREKSASAVSQVHSVIVGKEMTTVEI